MKREVASSRGCAPGPRPGTLDKGCAAGDAPGGLVRAARLPELYPVAVDLGYVRARARN
jgi:hypothetical protein